MTFLLRSKHCKLNFLFWSVERLIRRIFSGFEVVPAFVLVEEVTDIADSAPEGVDGSRLGLPRLGKNEATLG